MNDTVIALLMIIVILMLAAHSPLGKIKAPTKIRRLSGNTSWRIKFFDDNKWLKWTLIIILRIIAEITCFLWRLVSYSFRLGSKGWFAKIGKGL
jgi:hypothetical protein